MARTLIVLLLLANAAMLAVWRQWIPGIEDPREPMRVERQLRNDALIIVRDAASAATAGEATAPGTAEGSGRD